MSSMKLKIKKQRIKRKIDGVVTEGYYGRVITNGVMTFEEIAENSSLNTSLHKGEVAFASLLLLEGAERALRQGYIVDLGPLGRLYPAVDGVWHLDEDDVKLSELKTKVTYRPSEKVKEAIGGAQLSWTNVAATSENSDSEDEPINTNNGGNNGGSEEIG